jgi:hypothetical protein
MLQQLRLLQSLPALHLECAVLPAVSAVQSRCCAAAQSAIGMAGSASAQRTVSSVSADHAVTPSSGGKGFGFPHRFKDMSDKELKRLLRKSEPTHKTTEGPRKVAPAVPWHQTGPFEHQWTRLPERITEQYTAHSINQTDIFAVIEAGHGQFKGVH